MRLFLILLLLLSLSSQPALSAEVLPGEPKGQSSDFPTIYPSLIPSPDPSPSCLDCSERIATVIEGLGEVFNRNYEVDLGDGGLIAANRRCYQFVAPGSSCSVLGNYNGDASCRFCSPDGTCSAGLDINDIDGIFRENEWRDFDDILERGWLDLPITNDLRGSCLIENGDVSVRVGGKIRMPLSVLERYIGDPVVEFCYKDPESGAPTCSTSASLPNGSTFSMNYERDSRIISAQGDILIPGKGFCPDVKVGVEFKDSPANDPIWGIGLGCSLFDDPKSGARCDCLFGVCYSPSEDDVQCGVEFPMTLPGGWGKISTGCRDIGGSNEAYFQFCPDRRAIRESIRKRIFQP